MGDAIQGLRESSRDLPVAVFVDLRLVGGVTYGAGRLVFPADRQHQCLLAAYCWFARETLPVPQRQVTRASIDGIS